MARASCVAGSFVGWGPGSCMMTSGEVATGGSTSTRFRAMGSTGVTRGVGSGLLGT